MFLECQDDISFYLPVVRQIWGSHGGITAYDCYGKDNVIALIPRVKAKLDQQWRALLFIDKDVDDLCGISCPNDSQLFQTCYYSIENHLVNPDVLVVIWTELIRLSATDARLADLLDVYSVSYRSFVESIRLVMAWTILHRRRGRKVSLNDVKMENMVQLDHDCHCMLRPEWQAHIAAASNLHDISYDKA
jgi:hypothetical protein